MKYIIRKGETRPLAQLLDDMAEAIEQVPQLVTVKDYEATRKLEQNNYYWAMLSQVSKWRYAHEGDTTIPLVIHHQMKKQFQPVIGSYLAETVINGQVVEYEETVHKSTTQNTAKEMAEYTEQVIAFWVDYGVQFEAHRSDMLPSREDNE